MKRAFIGLTWLVVAGGCIPVTVNLNFNFPKRELEEKFYAMELQIEEESQRQEAMGIPPSVGDAAAFDPVVQEGKVDIDVKTPAIDKITESRAKRLALLREQFKDGRIGETNEGTIGVRNDFGLAGKEKADFNKLVKAENEDRSALMKEILKANKLTDEQLENVRKAFAKARYRSLAVGFYFQDKKGEWRQKTEEDKKKLDKGEEIE